MIPTQRHLFAMPRDVAYLNCAYMGPLMNSVVSACDVGVRMKATPWTLTIPDFYDPVDEARRQGHSHAQTQYSTFCTSCEC